MSTTDNLLPIRLKNNIPTIDSRIIADKIGNEHKAIMQLLTNHKNIIDRDFGVLTFEMGKPKNKGGRPTKTALLTEGQALFIVTLSKNTKQAVDLKSKIVKSFMFFREQTLKKTKNKELAYFEKKEQLYKQKYQCETELRILRYEIGKSKKGMELKRKIAELKDIKKKIAGMDKKQFGYTYNLFSLLGKNNEID